jgi:hypothetical protein
MKSRCSAARRELHALREANGTKLRPGVVIGLLPIGSTSARDHRVPSTVEHESEDRAVRKSFAKRRDAHATIALALRRQRHDSRVMSRRREKADLGRLDTFGRVNDVTASLFAR